MNEREFGSTVIPSMHYRDAHAAINWLCDILEFERQLVVPGEARTISHAQMTLGTGMIMLGSAHEDDTGNISAATGKIGGDTYIVMTDIAAFYDRVRARGAEIVMELTEQHYGGSLFSVRDPEGWVWHVGSYNPWTDKA